MKAHVCSSHSRSRAREAGSEAVRPRADGGSRPRDGRSERVVPALDITRLAGIPDEVRQAALAVKRRREAEVAEQVSTEYEGPIDATSLSPLSPFFIFLLFN